MRDLPQQPKLAFISQPEYFRFTYEDDLREFAQVKEFKFNYSLTAEHFSDLLSYSADINFFFRGEFMPDEVLRRLQGITVNLSSEPFPRSINGRSQYTADSLARYLAFRTIRNKPFDYVFHYDAASLGFMRRDGLRLSGDFPFSVATDVYKPSAAPKRWDVFFIGRSTAHRESFFGPLKHYHHFLHLCHGVWGSGLVDYINASRICLNVHAENEISWEPRLQMMLACGAFVISQPITPNPYLRPGTDFVVVSDPSRMFEAVSYYLKHEDERNVIAKCGCDRVRQLLCSKSLFRDLVQGLLQHKYPKFEAGTGHFLLDTYGRFRTLSSKILRRPK